MLAIDAPPNLPSLLAGAPAHLVWLARLAAFDVALLFATRGDAGAIWIAWRGKALAVATELSESVVRATGLASGLVDVKVCAIDATWAGLKFVRRLRDRKR